MDLVAKKKSPWVNQNHVYAEHCFHVDKEKANSN